MGIYPFRRAVSVYSFASRCVSPSLADTARWANAAPFGGPVTVTVRNEAESEDSNDQFILFAPRFTATVSLTADQSQVLRAGELAKIRVGSVGKTVGEHLYGKLERWLRRKVDPTAQI